MLVLVVLVVVVVVAVVVVVVAVAVVVVGYSFWRPSLAVLLASAYRGLLQAATGLWPWKIVQGRTH